MKANCGLSLTGLIVLAAGMGITAGRAHGDFTFGAPTNLGPGINSSGMDDSPSVSMDGLELYFLSDRPGGQGAWDIWVTTRPTTDDPWGTPANLGPVVNGPDLEISPDLSADGLSLYFDARLAGRCDIWVAQRPAKDQPWAKRVNLGPSFNLVTNQFCPGISPDGLQLYFESGGEIWISTRQTQSEAWQPAVNLGSPVNTSYADGGPDISFDGLVMLLHSNRPGGYGDPDLYVATRRTTDSDWGNPINLGPRINTSYSESDACVSADGRTLYFSEYPNPRPGGHGGLDLWQAPIVPVVDFNADGKVDLQDLLRLIESWGKDDPSVDMGPMPWGDGNVDREDLDILMDYWGKEVNDPTLIACWRLDEVEGTVAADTTGASDGTLVGDPIWQPEGGRLGGALQLDGVNDHVSTPFVVDLAKGPFSLLAWVKGGAPGQVIFSRARGANWLMASSPDGTLATDLKSTNRSIKPLTSAVVVVGGEWHRVGLSWDGSHRILYVDESEVSGDAPGDLAPSIGGLQIGAGSTLAAGSFWNGLIDDVRIYNRAVRP